MLVLKIVEGPIWILQINRESALNALNKEVISQLDILITEAEADESCKGLIITGTGPKSFIAGADISEFQGLNEAEGAQLSRLGQRLFQTLEDFPKPAVAAVNGFALGGGCELAMACHLRIAGSHARFGQPEVNLGLIPGYGGTQRLAKLIGKTKALELLMTGDMILAQEAKELGLVNQVVEPGQEVETSKVLLLKILTKAPLAIREIIRCVNLCHEPGDRGMTEEAIQFGKLISSEDAKEGIQAFMEKRKATFKGI